MRQFTDEEMEILSQAERTFDCAVHGQWYRNLDSRLAKQIWEIYHEAYEWNGRFNPNCSACMLELVTSCGIRYYQQKCEKPVKVEVKEIAEAKAEQRVKVQTKKSRK